MHKHAFYIALGYGVSALLLAIEVLALYLAARRSRKSLHTEDPL
ncbi:heme exporter protein CcmD [Diaphorobacter ruginosibacter]|uniref:Heme exporter protein D n=1 Tax=Diaphorobacter ruginosibacter TaxID=1715720 RepID=A0A7G9RJ82_9BURK|nr:heme exporter protein CcmD [Diaphorobacter ruginosibacter]QNN55657.1 heme exporter protein CcmD [Diaphorobacter ruginosibacter]